MTLTTYHNYLYPQYINYTGIVNVLCLYPRLYDIDYLHPWHSLHRRHFIDDMPPLSKHLLSPLFNWFTKYLHSECHSCCISRIIEYVLIICTTLECARTSLYRHCLASHLPFGAKVLLHVDFPSKPLISFLRDPAFSSSIWSPPAKCFGRLLIVRH